MIAIKWFSVTDGSSKTYDNRSLTFDQPSRKLAIGQESGLVYLMANEIDEEPLVIESALDKVTCVEWNCSGTVLAVAGEVCNGSTDKSKDIGEMASNQLLVKFYEATSGRLMHVLSVPGQRLNACSWEKSGLRMLLAVDCFVYFVHVRPSHLWTLFADTLVFATERVAHLNSILFCQIRSGKVSCKSMAGLNGIVSSGQYCVLSTDKSRPVEMDTNGACSGIIASAQPTDDELDDSTRMKSSLYICNSIGTSVDTVNVEYKINCMAMNSRRVFAAGNEGFCIWRFRNPWTGKKSSSNTADSPGVFGFSFEDGNSETEHVEEDQTSGGFDRLFNVTLSRTDSIAAICCTEKLLLVGQISGTVHVYNLPNVTLAQRVQCNVPNPISMHLNSESDRLAMLNTSRQLNVFRIEQFSNGALQPEVIKDVWDFQWSLDNSQWLAYIQRGRLFIRTVTLTSTSDDTEPPLGSTLGYIGCISDLQVTIALLDHIALQLQHLQAKSSLSDSAAIVGADGSGQSDQPILRVLDFIVKFDSNLLHQTRQLFEQQSLNEVTAFIEQNSNPRLWRLLAESALESFQWNAAELGFVRERDVFGVQLVKRVSQLADDRWKRAEVLLYFGRAEEAEKVYLNEGRADLAIEMWQMLGNWSRVWTLLQEDGCADPVRLDEARLGWANDLQEQGQFADAATQFGSLGLLKQFVECCALGQQFDRLVAAVRSVVQAVGINLPMDPDDAPPTRVSTMYNEFVVDDSLSWPDDVSGWQELAQLMQSLGECELAAQCYLAADQPQASIDCCVRLNQWRLAIRLATQQNSAQVQHLLAGYAAELANKHRWMEVIQLFAEANQSEAAFQVMMAVVQVAHRSRWCVQDMKKLYVLVGLLRTQFNGKTDPDRVVNQSATASRRSSETNDYRSNTKTEFQVTGTSMTKTKSESVAASTVTSAASSKIASNRLLMLLNDTDAINSIPMKSTGIDASKDDQFGGMQLDRQYNSIEAERSIEQSTRSIVEQLNECKVTVHHQSKPIVDCNEWSSSTVDDRSARAMLLKRDAWKGAEAFHFYLLSQTQLQEGYVDAAMHTSLLLIDYEQFLSPISIYSLIALTAAANRNMAVCSKAFIRLEALEQQKTDSGQASADSGSDESDTGAWIPTSTGDTLASRNISFASLAVQLFSRQPPKQPRSSSCYECPLCENPLVEGGGGRCSKCENRFAICVASGRPILENGSSWVCSVCRHQAIQADLVGFTCCPLCQHAIK